MAKEHKPIKWLIESGLRSADNDFWEAAENNRTKCLLCPRKCVISDGHVGFCKARYNSGGLLKTAIWGKLLTPSIEPIETEAIFHCYPGQKILSIGNLGCNLNCDFCQNWESSNMDNLSPEHIKYHTPESIVDLTESLGVKVLSFTYNDPVIWFEYLYETAKLARSRGIRTLFKSAGFISPLVAKALTEVIDIFSISLKSINPVTFRKMSTGILNPVLAAIKIFYQSGRHLEISNLVVPGLTDKPEEIRLLAQWIKQELSVEVPLHFVRFHPCYNYIHVNRTSIDFLENARRIALDEGLKYIYIGNTFQKGHGDLRCPECGNLIIERFGLYTNTCGLSEETRCSSCGLLQDIKTLPPSKPIDKIAATPQSRNHVWLWSDADTRNLHLEIKNASKSTSYLVCNHFNANEDIIDCETMMVPAESELRIAVGQVADEEKFVRISHSESIQCEISQLMDRAHFPLEAVC